MSGDDIVRKIKEILGESPTVSFDCSGSEICVRIVLKATKRGGAAVLIGMRKLEKTVPLSGAFFQEIDVLGGNRYCNELPDNMSYEEGALMEPLSVGVHASRRGNVHVGSIVLVLGAGPISLVTLLSAKAFGASKVLITDILDERLKVAKPLDILDERLKVAKSLGADYTLKIEKHMTEQDIIKKITDLLGEDL